MENASKALIMAGRCVNCYHGSEFHDVNAKKSWIHEH